MSIVKTKNEENEKNNKNKDKPEIIPINEFSNFDLCFKIIIIGNCGVGKTCITNQGVKSEFSEGYQSTIGVEYFTMFIKLDNKIIKLQIWDTCGMEVYRSLIKSFYINSSLAVIVYAINDSDSFNDIHFWVKELKTMSSPDIKIILIGNKIDLENERKVSYEEGQCVAKEYGFQQFFETSAKTGENIKEMFLKISSILYKDYLKYSDNIDPISSSNPNSKPSLRLKRHKKKSNKKKCCG